MTRPYRDGSDLHPVATRNTLATALVLAICCGAIAAHALGVL